MKISQVYEGWKNHLYPSKYLKETIKKVSKERLEICRSCELHSSNKKNYSSLRADEHCTDCGCTLLAKTKCLGCSCPKDKWLQVVTDNEYKNIKDGK